MSKARASTALSGLRTDFQALFEQHSAGLERAEAEVAALRTQLEEKSREAANLKATLVSERSMHAAESARLDAERCTHEKVLREKDVEIAEAKQAVSRVEGEWRERWGKLGQELATAKAAAETARAEAETAQITQSRMEALLRTETGKLRESAELIDTLRHELGSALVAKRRLETDLEILQGQLGDLLQLAWRQQNNLPLASNGLRSCSQSPPAKIVRSSDDDSSIVMQASPGQSAFPITPVRTTEPAQPSFSVGRTPDGEDNCDTVTSTATPERQKRNGKKVHFAPTPVPTPSPELLHPAASKRSCRPKSVGNQPLLKPPSLIHQSDKAKYLLDDDASDVEDDSSSQDFGALWRREEQQVTQTLVHSMPEPSAPSVPSSVSYSPASTGNKESYGGKCDCVWKLHRLDNLVEIVLPVGKSIIGRGPVTMISFPTISRHHCEMTVTFDGHVSYRQVEKHPCYLKCKGTNTFLLCPAAQLSEGDQLSLSFKDRSTECGFELEREKGTCCSIHKSDSPPSDTFAEFVEQSVTPSSSGGQVPSLGRSPSARHRTGADSVMDMMFE